MGGWAKWVGGIKEDTWDEHWVSYVSDESLVGLLKPILRCMLTKKNFNKNLRQTKKRKS